MLPLGLHRCGTEKMVALTRKTAVRRPSNRQAGLLLALHDLGHPLLAVQDATAQAKEKSEKEMGDLTGGMQMPGGFF